MNDMAQLYEAMALHETGRAVFNRLFPSQHAELEERALKLDIAAKKRMLGMPLSDDDLEDGGSWGDEAMRRAAPRVHQTLLQRLGENPRQASHRARLLRPRGTLAMLLRSGANTFERGITNASRAATRRIFG